MGKEKRSFTEIILFWYFQRKINKRKKQQNEKIYLKFSRRDRYSLYFLHDAGRYFGSTVAIPRTTILASWSRTLELFRISQSATNAFSKPGIIGVRRESKIKAITKMATQDPGGRRDKIWTFPWILFISVNSWIHGNYPLGSNYQENELETYLWVRISL